MNVKIDRASLLKVVAELRRSEDDYRKKSAIAKDDATHAYNRGYADALLQEALRWERIADLVDDEGGEA